MTALGEGRARKKAPRPWLKTTGRINSECNVALTGLGREMSLLNEVLTAYGGESRGSR
jgi:hypothetical protein